MTAPKFPHKPPRVLVVGHGAISTGFARVIHSVLERLPNYEFHHFSPYYRGPALLTPWPIYPNQLAGDVYGLNQVAGHVENVRPDIVLFVDDIGIMPLHLKRLRELRARLGFRVAAYLPSDDEPIPPGAIRALEELDLVVAYTETGARVLGAAARAAGLGDVPIAIIPHGVDRDRFHPLGAPASAPWLPDRVAARRAFFGSDRHEADFIVLNANRNQPRKRIDLTLEGFALFAKGKPSSVRIYLHMGVTQPGADQLARARLLGIEDRLLPGACSPHHPALSDERLNLLYNACDVGVNTATAEGWGLVAFEHAATGAAQVMCGHGVREELWADHATLLPTHPVTVPSGLVIARDTTAEELGRALEDLYLDREKLAESARKSFMRTEDPSQDWRNIASLWDHHLRASLLSSPIRPTPS